MSLKLSDFYLDSTNSKKDLKLHINEARTRSDLKLLMVVKEEEEYTIYERIPSTNSLLKFYPNSKLKIEEVSRGHSGYMKGDLKVEIL